MTISLRSISKQLPATSIQLEVPAGGWLLVASGMTAGGGHD